MAGHGWGLPPSAILTPCTIEAVARQHLQDPICVCRLNEGFKACIFGSVPLEKQRQCKSVTIALLDSCVSSTGDGLRLGK
jgi:hypothetical protein